MQELLEKTLFDTSYREWLIIVGISVGVTIALAAINRLLVWRFASFAKRTRNRIDDYVAELFKKTKLFFLAAVGLYATLRFAEVSDGVQTTIGRIAFILLLLQVAIWGNHLITVYIKRYRELKLEEDAGAVTTIQAVGFVGKLILYTVVLLLALDNLGIDVTALIASLGIGGIAIALAVQNILGDLFASLSIVLDKPFVVGDFLIVGDHMGSVERVGLKTTRLRSLSGEQLIFSNSDLLGSRIRNFRRMFERRIAFEVGVTYGTSKANLIEIPGIIQDAIEGQENTRFERSHFKTFGDSALIFETVYHVLVADYAVYMDIQQDINLKLVDAFSAKGIEFAFPTQTLHVEPIEASVEIVGDGSA